MLAHNLAQFFPVILASHCAKIFAFQSLFTVWKWCLEPITVTKVSDKLSLSSCLIRFRVIVNSCVDIADSVFSRGCKNGANTFSLTLPDSNRKCCSHKELLSIIYPKINHSRSNLFFSYIQIHNHSLIFLGFCRGSDTSDKPRWHLLCTFMLRRWKMF